MIWLKASMPLLRKVVASSVISEAWVAAMVYCVDVGEVAGGGLHRQVVRVVLRRLHGVEALVQHAAKSRAGRRTAPVADVGETAARCRPSRRADGGQAALSAPMAGTVTSAVPFRC